MTIEQHDAIETVLWEMLGNWYRPHNSAFRERIFEAFDATKSDRENGESIWRAFCSLMLSKGWIIDERAIPDIGALAREKLL